MAKRAKIDENLFAKTDKGQKAPDIVKARGVGLASSEWAEFDEIADALGMNPHALRVYALRYFVKDYKAGKIATKTEKVTTLPNLS